MGQSDILEFLEKHPDKWFYAKEISENVNIGSSSLNYSLNQLIKYGEVFHKSDDSKPIGRKPFLFKHKD